MIAKGKSISHGAAMVEYAAGRDKAQFLTSRFMDLDFEETFGIMPDNIWNSFKLHAMRHSPIENSLMRFEIAPRREETEDWTHDDWKDLLQEFMNEIDNIHRVRYRDKKGRWKEMEVKPTNLKNSQSIAYLHLNTDDNHLHFLVNRIDEDDNVNDDSFLRNRCFMAAQIINQRRGWQSTLERSEEIKASIRSSVYDTLKQMGCFSWPNFIEAMKMEGIIVSPKYDNSRHVVNYKISMEGCRNKYNASDIDRNLTVAHIEGTWRRVHEDYEKKALRAAVIGDYENLPDVTPKKPESSPVSQERHTVVYDTPRYSAPVPKVTMNHRHQDSLIHHAIQYGYREFKFELKNTIEALIRSEIAAMVNEEKAEARATDDDDSKEYLSFLNKEFNSESAFHIGALLFLGYVDGATSISNSVGGGGGSCTGGWGKKKDDDDDDRKWARRCARQAVKMCKPWHIGRRRGRGR